MSDKFIQNSSNESNGAESQVAAEDTVQGNNAAQETQTRQGSNGSYNQYGNQNIGGPPYPQYQPYPPRPYSYEPYKRVEQDDILGHVSSKQAFAVVLLCSVFGVLFSAIFLRGGFGLSVPLLCTLFYSFAVWYMSKKDAKPSRESKLLLIPIGLLSYGFFLNDNQTVYFINVLLLLVLIPLQLCHMSQTSGSKLFTVQSAYDTIISTVSRPFSYLDTPFKAVSQRMSKGVKESRFFMVFLGALAALPLAYIFISLFSVADSAFGYFVNRLVEKIDISFGTILFDIVFGFLSAMFVSTWLITLRARKKPEAKGFNINASFNGVIVSTVLVILNLIQLAFVAVQFGYLFAGMKLPGGMTYSQYARSGFFELCGVLCISVMIIIFCLIFVKKHEGRLPKSVSLLLTLFIACNFVVVVSAVFRMLTYIKVYDLSVKRFMVTWLIVIFALCLIGAVIKIWSPRFNLPVYAVIVTLIMTASVNLVNVNRIIAEYNVDCYIQSIGTDKPRDIDTEYLAALGPSAAKATLRLYENCQPSIRPGVKKALNRQKNQLDSKSWKNMCIYDIEASRILEGVNELT